MRMFRRDERPVSIGRSSGNVRIHTENGPISINLKGTTWSGAGLTADAQNGPLTLSVPSDYKSSFSVESRNYSPMSCHVKHLREHAENLGRQQSPDRVRCFTGDNPAFDRERPGFHPIFAVKCNSGFLPHLFRLQPNAAA